jgi:hypothetical protein
MIIPDTEGDAAEIKKRDHSWIGIITALRFSMMMGVLFSKDISLTLFIDQLIRFIIFYRGK